MKEIIDRDLDRYLTDQERREDEEELLQEARDAEMEEIRDDSTEMPRRIM